MVNAQSQIPSGRVAIGDSGYYIGAQTEGIALRLKAPQSVRIIDARDNRTLSTLTVHWEDLTAEGLPLFVGQSVETSENVFGGYEIGFMLPGETFDSDILVTEICARPTELYRFSGVVDGGKLGLARSVSGHLKTHEPPNWVVT